MRPAHQHAPLRTIGTGGGYVGRGHVLERGLGLFVCFRQCHPQLQAVQAVAAPGQVGRTALGMHHAAAGGHPVHCTGLDALARAGGVVVQQRAVEQVGHGRQADVRVRPHVMLVGRLHLQRAEVVEEQERPPPPAGAPLAAAGAR
jgi:hypothetical protein